MDKTFIEDMGATDAIKLELETLETANHPQIMRVY